MKFKILDNDTELNLYRHVIHKHIDVLLPLDYLKQGTVYGLHNNEGDLCGGFTLITKGPFRVLQSIPDFQGLELDPDLSQTAEVTGVWLCSESKGKFTSAKFWLTMLQKVLMSDKKYFVYAYTSHKVKLGEIYAKTAPIVLFRGETKILPGMDAPEHESVELLIKKRLFIQALKNSDFFLKRFYPDTSGLWPLVTSIFKKGKDNEAYPDFIYSFMPAQIRSSRSDTDIDS